MAMLDLTTPKLVAVVTPHALDADLSRAAEAAPDIVEYRADLRSTHAPQAILAELAYVRDALVYPVLFTLRDSSEGGEFDGGDTLRQEIYAAAIPAVDAIDIELRHAEVFDALRPLCREHGTPGILSFHDFAGTPGNGLLDTTVVTGVQNGATVVKVATLCETAEDALRLLELPLRHRDARTAIVGMGRFGPMVRASAPMMGSVLGYASLTKAVAPGQLTVEELRHVWEMLGPRQGRGLVD
jgi:3-dehydroquinate dehydratase-1